ncbi:MAG: metalloregulator ArsR/SmtB family transcription factor [Johnsonella sp.]|nr:metalloregulator ArsR/SmtB family transcription factor [Johnsonella sp.]
MREEREDNPDNARILHLANLLKAVSHPARLCIVKRLFREGPCNVGYFTDCMGISQSGISQHLSKLRDMGIVEAKKQGTEVYYSLVDKDISNMIKSFF